jgi:methylmalonyl-CoA mutase, N-terminal domain
VGVNDYRNDDDAQIPILRIDPEMERKQAGRLEATRAKRDSSAVEAVLGQLKSAAGGSENLMPHLLAAARARASEGEMVAALQEVFGTYAEQPVF